MEIVIVINTLALLSAMIYLVKKGSQDKLDTIREVSKVMLAKDMTEYVEAIPEDNEEEEEVIPDELETLEEVDEKVLIKHLNEKYENIKD